MRLMPEKGEAPREVLAGATGFRGGTQTDGLQGVCFILTQCDFHGLRILPGRETAEPTWLGAELWLMEGNSPTTTDLGVGVGEWSWTQYRNQLTHLFPYPCPEMQKWPVVTPGSDML